MNRQALLSTARLRLTADSRVSKAHRDRTLILSSSGAYPLVVTSGEAALLSECFQTAATVPSALASLLRQRRCPSLRNFYELILQAHAAGVLAEENAAPKPSPAWNWCVSLPAGAAMWVGSVLIIGGAILLPFGTWQMPRAWLEWLAAPLVASLLLSLGEALSAMPIRGAGAEVRPERRRRIPPLYFKLDAAEAAMGGPACQMGAAALRIVPAAVVSAAAAWQFPGMLLGSLVAFAWVLKPWGDSAALQWLRGHAGTPHLSVPDGELLMGNGDHGNRTSNWADLTSKGRLGWVTWAALWTIGIVAALRRFSVAWFAQLESAVRAWGRAGSSSRIATAGLLALIGAVALTWFVGKVRHWIIMRRLRAPFADKRSPITRDAPLTAATLIDVLRQFAVLHDLSDDDRGALAAAVGPLEVGAGATVFEEDSAADAFYFVLDGELEVRKRLPGRLGRRKVIGLLGPGDSFGEIALLENTVRTASVSARRPSRLLRLAREDFDRLLTQRVGAAKLRQVLQNTAFLGRLVHFAGWSFDDLARFARRCTSMRFDAGATVRQADRTNGYFYIVYDGVLEERDGKTTVRRLLPGDYFGEEGIIRTHAGARDTVAIDYFGAVGSDLPPVHDVIAIEESRCLAMPGSDFIDFFARDFRVSVRMAASVGQK